MKKLFCYTIVCLLLVGIFTIPTVADGPIWPDKPPTANSTIIPS